MIGGEAEWSADIPEPLQRVGGETVVSCALPQTAQQQQDHHQGHAVHSVQLGYSKSVKDKKK